MTDLKPHPLVVAPPGGTCWKRSDRRGQASEPSSHAELVVLHTVSGRADYVLDGRLVPLRPGTLLWALSGQAHFLLNDGPDFDMWVFLISDRVLPRGGAVNSAMPPLHVGQAEGGLNGRVLTRLASQELTGIAEGLAEIRDSDVRLSGLRWWLARAWAHWQRAEETAARRIHPAADRAARALQSDPALSLADLARAAGLSASRLAHVFRQEFGRSLKDYRTDLKLDHVDHLINTGAVRDLTSAALEAGFGSYSQFYRVFMAARGQAPGAYFKDQSEK